MTNELYFPFDIDNKMQYKYICSRQKINGSAESQAL